MSALDENPQPTGTLTLQTQAMPRDTNPQGDVFAGWLMSQMDTAGAILAQSIARGRVTTVAVGSMVFLRPVPVGSTVSCYAEALEVGRSSIRTMVEVWLTRVDSGEQVKVTEGEFVFVAIDDHGRTRPLPQR
ncbi:acyl-CoA thioesterase [Microbulbifer thermotolerans]|uniref:Acyl-CoA thioesterase n=1 Tax=Microbulbifer thermotolerans TaxID=252514 RepID=A0A143HQ77_MICTH|nr:acyl-CoA thioesterase [Microbulbifer thermotolerans]AMX03895.1 acyl-CoA thioesterase [Microbulbifer thermotolerans]MCX2778585.1 acyl-CoA thioesterase [Microbulbifer thermotolerans]MCX2782869.1 acyl-CoA thioesterase [Microbulbifer thermotolerans]MCX2794061.1 acyl-CoA thioesterase [Microbulbifer thermotolerans]MCX2802956.1 acyl-CoA thioesterase [Microbulbifer thermotolerans]